MNKSDHCIPYPAAPRNGCIDLWNSHILQGASYDRHDIPFCPTTATTIPTQLISLPKAKALYKKEMEKGNSDFIIDAFIHSYIDDQYFDGSKEGYWAKPEKLITLVRHFAGMITIDYSTYLDFPDPYKRVNTLRMRGLGFYAGKNGIPIINNVRWGERETWGYSFSGLPKNSIYAIGTVASAIRRHGYQQIFTSGLLYMIQKLNPYALIIYGSASLPIFNTLRKQGIKIIVFKSDTANYYERRTNDE